MEHNQAHQVALSDMGLFDSTTTKRSIFDTDDIQTGSINPATYTAPSPSNVFNTSMQGSTPQMTPDGFVSPAGVVASAFIQGPGRVAGGILASVDQAITGTPSTYQPEGYFMKGLFGDAPIESFQTQFAKSTSDASQLVGPGFAPLVGGLATFGGAALDAAMFGPGKVKVVSEIIAIKNTTAGLKKAEELGLSKSLWDSFANAAVKAETPEAAETLLKNFSDVQKTLKAPATSVISYIDSSGKKVFTTLAREELDLLKDELRFIPEARSGASQIHLDAVKPNLRNVATEVSRADFLAGHPQAKEVFDSIKSLEKVSAHTKNAGETTVKEYLRKAYNRVKTEGNRGFIKNPFAGKGSGANTEPIPTPKRVSGPSLNDSTVKTASTPPGSQLQTLASKPLGTLKTSSPDGITLPPAVKAVTEALKAAKPIRGKQEELYSAERARRVAVISNMKATGEGGYFKQLGALKGELPKAQFEGIRKSVTQEHIDELFDLVEKANVTAFEKISAKTGLARLLGAEGGIVPTKSEMSLLSEIFPPEFIKQIMDKRPFMERLWGGIANALNLPRAVMATADLSAPLRQGIFLAGRPKQFVPAFASMFKYAFSEKAYEGLMSSIKTRPTYLSMRENKLALTDMGQTLSTREEAFMSNIAEKIPGFKYIARGSNRAYSGFLNKLRADVFDDLTKKAKALGITEERPEVMRDIAKFVNSATGRGDMGALNKATEVLNGVFFSPRLMASRINLLNPVFYTRLDPFVRKEALKSLLTFGAIGSTIVGLAKAGGVDVGIDPRSADFGKIKTGDTRYDPWGGFQQYIVLAARLLSGQMVSSTTGKEFNLGEGYKPTTRLDIVQRFFENKTSPVASFALGLMKGQNALGEPFNVPAETVERFLPMVTQDVFDLVREYGPKGLGMAIPGVFGVGSQTYSDQIPMATKTPTGKDSVKWRSAPGLGESILNKITGKELTTFTEEEQVKLSAERKAEQIRQADLDRAKNLVLKTGESMDVGDTHVFLDNGVVRTSTSDIAEPKAQFRPTYNTIQDLVKTGNTNEAKGIIDGLSDEQYKLYVSLRADDRRNRTEQLRDLLKKNPADAVAYLREQTSEEQTRLLNLMTDEEYALYEQGKE